jgi:GntR family transcriptional repressor for pyruvate dehydrogenase complex
LEKELLHIKIVREIIALISSGHFKDGQRLPAERKLCEQFGVSRGTLRQSLADLEKMGIVVIRPGSGIYVKKFSSKKIPRRILPVDCNNTTLADIIIARKAIEIAAMELACQRITEKEIQHLKKLIRNMEDSLDSLPDFLKHDILFHESLVRASGNPALVTAFEAIAEYHKYSQVFSSSHTNCEDLALACHKKLLSALEKNNPKIGRNALTRHFAGMKE